MINLWIDLKHIFLFFWIFIAFFALLSFFSFFAFFTFLSHFYCIFISFYHIFITFSTFLSHFCIFIAFLHFSHFYFKTVKSINLRFFMPFFAMHQNLSHFLYRTVVNLRRARYMLRSYVTPGESYWSGRLSTVDPLVLTSLHKLLFIWTLLSTFQQNKLP